MKLVSSTVTRQENAELFKKSAKILAVNRFSLSLSRYVLLRILAEVSTEFELPSWKHKSCHRLLR